MNLLQLLGISGLAIYAAVILLGKYLDHKTNIQFKKTEETISTLSGVPTVVSWPARTASYPSIENIRKTQELIKNHHDKYGGYNVSYILLADYGYEDGILNECFNHLEGSIDAGTLSCREAVDNYKFLLALKEIPEEDRIAAEPCNTSEHATEWCC